MTSPPDMHPKPPVRYRLVQAMMGPLLKRVGLSCRQFAELASVRMDRPLTGSEAVRYRLHRIMCALCRRLPSQLEDVCTAARCSGRHDDEDGDGDDDAEDEGEFGPGLGPVAKQRIRSRLAASPFEENAK